MTVIVLTTEEKERLEGTYEGRELKFVPDNEGDFIVGVGVLEMPEFSSIHSELDALPRKEHKPIEPVL